MTVMTVRQFRDYTYKSASFTVWGEKTVIRQFREMGMAQREKVEIPQHLIDEASAVSLFRFVDIDALRRESNREFSGPCPKCGGDDRFHATERWFFCRQCHEKPGDAIDYLRWRDGLTFVEAVSELTGVKLEGSVNATETQTQAKSKEKPRPATWQRDAERLVAESHARLFDADNLDNPGAAYLLRRGLTYDTWQAFGIGYAHHYNRETRRNEPAIVLPWYGRNGLSAVRFRFLEAVNGLRLVALKESDFSGVLFGRNVLPVVAEERRTLILCEGEINAMSIWQTQHEAALDVLSVGSESAKITQPMIDYARRFMRVIVWMDKPYVSRQLMDKIPGAYGISSPVIEGQKRDANDLLCEGLLGAYLATLRFKAAQSDEEKLRLHYDLTDAMQIPACFDEATLRVVEKVKGELQHA